MLCKVWNSVSLKVTVFLALAFSKILHLPNKIFQKQGSKPKIGGAVRWRDKLGEIYENQSQSKKRNIKQFVFQLSHISNNGTRNYFVFFLIITLFE